MTSRAKVLLTFVRYRSANPKMVPKRWKEEGVKYGHVTYYPRHPDHVDPPFQPSKVLMVHRVKPFRGEPYWNKDTLTKLGFEEEKNTTVLVKNTPEMCQLLWTIKHLIKVTPVKLPEQLPDKEELIDRTYLHENGTLYFTPKVDSVRYEAAERYRNCKKRLNTDMIQEKLRLKWLKGGDL